MTLDEIRHELKDRRATTVARACGIHFQTVRRIRDGIIKNPSPETLTALSSYIESRRYKAEAIGHKAEARGYKA